MDAESRKASSKGHVVLTAVGPDRPGIVKEIASIIHASGCNVEDSRMAILAGEFAIIMLFSGPANAIDRVKKASVPRLERDLLFRITFKETAPAGDPQICLTQRLTVTGNDQPGIVHRVSEAVASQGINVRSFESRVSPAAFSGTPLFTLHAELQIPDPGALHHLRGNLDHVCDDLELTYALEPIDA